MTSLALQTTQAPSLLSPKGVLWESFIDSSTESSTRFKEKLREKNRLKNDRDPVVLILMGKDAANIENWNRISLRSVATEALLLPLAETHRIALRSFLPYQIKETIQEISQIGGKKVDVLLLGAHGTPDSIDSYRMANVKAADFEDLSAQAQIILCSCSTGPKDGIGEKISSVSGKSVCAPQKNMLPALSSIFYCAQHRRLEMSTYRGSLSQHGVIWQNNKVHFPCIDKKQEEQLFAEKLDYVEKNSDINDASGAGWLFYVMGNIPKAIKLYEKADRLIASLLLEREGRHDEAMDALRKAVKEKSQYALALMIVLSEKDRPAAFEQYRATIDRHILSPTSSTEGTQLKESDFVEAIRWYGNGKPMADVLVYLGTKEPLLGAQYLWHQLAEMCGSVAAMRYLGNREEDRGWLEKAAAKNDVTAMVDLGEEYDRENDLSSAKIWYERAIAAGSEKALSRLGSVFVRSGKIKEAIQCYEKAAQGDDEFLARDAMHMVGVLQQRMGNMTQAKSAWQKASDSHSSIARIMLGYLALEEKNSNEATQWFQWARWHHDTIFFLLEQEKNFDEAIKYCMDKLEDRMYRYSPFEEDRRDTKPSYQFALGYAYEKKGLWLEAKKWYEKAATSESSFTFMAQKKVRDLEKKHYLAMALSPYAKSLKIGSFSILALVVGIVAKRYFLP